MLRGKLSTGPIGDYADPLGYLTGGDRLTLGALQCAIGVAPSSVVIGQPFEVLVVVQQLTDQPIKFQAALRLPYRDQTGERASFVSPQLTIEATVAPSECVLLHFPIVAQAPTPGNQTYTFTVQIQAPTVRAGHFVRDPLGGRSPTLFAFSPLRMQILRDEVTFNRQSALPSLGSDILQTAVRVLPGEVNDKRELVTKVDQIWTPSLYAKDRAQASALMERTTVLANQLTRTVIYSPLLNLVPERFQQMGISLLPGESAAIAKIMTYAMDEGVTNDSVMLQEETLWYRHLSYFAEAGTPGDDPTWMLNRLFGAILYDATRVGWLMLAKTPKHPAALKVTDAEPRAKHFFEAWQQRKVVTAQVYLPLIMAGIILLPRIRTAEERVWRNLTALREAWQVRSTSMTHETIIRDFIPALFTQAEQDLVTMRILPN